MEVVDLTARRIRLAHWAGEQRELRRFMEGMGMAGCQAGSDCT
jgi:hypothetical protein